jgi:AcrR family transcriptional regulator
MDTDVKTGDRAAQRVARTEEHIVEAATRLFLANGYQATTLASVADEADVAARTVYVRFGTKAALFKRVLDVAVVGDTAPVDVLGREWMQRALTAPTLVGRLDAVVAGGRQIMERTGGLFATAQQAAALEPLVDEYWQQGRDGTRQAMRAVLTRAADDGLLSPGEDLDWLIDSVSLVVSAETYLLVARMIGSDVDRYARWLRQTLGRLVEQSAPA